MISFEAPVIEINGRNIIQLPEAASAQLSSRGLGMVRGTINDASLATALEPDGRKGHWFELDAAMMRQLGLNVGDSVTVEVEPSKDWIEPVVPADIQAGIEADGVAFKLWQSITPMARWEWIRWIRATNRAETRAHHIEVAVSKLRAGNRRPCCFNASMCTVPEISKNGVLLSLLQTA